MEFDALEKKIEQLNRINTRADHTSRDRYFSLYDSIYQDLLEMQSSGKIAIEAGSKGLEYLRKLLVNDDPEFSYSVVFWDKDAPTKKYKIGVCIRGLPICKPFE